MLDEDNLFAKLEGNGNKLNMTQQYNYEPLGYGQPAEYGLKKQDTNKSVHMSQPSMLHQMEMGNDRPEQFEEIGHQTL